MQNESWLIFRNNSQPNTWFTKGCYFGETCKRSYDYFTAHVSYTALVSLTWPSKKAKSDNYFGLFPSFLYFSAESRYSSGTLDVWLEFALWNTAPQEALALPVELM